MEGEEKKKGKIMLAIPQAITFGGYLGMIYMILKNDGSECVIMIKFVII